MIPPKGPRRQILIPKCHLKPFREMEARNTSRTRSREESNRAKGDEPVVNIPNIAPQQKTSLDKDIDDSKRNHKSDRSNLRVVARHFGPSNAR